MKGLAMPEENENAFDETGKGATGQTGEGATVPTEEGQTGEPAAGEDTNAQITAFKAKAEDEVAKRQALEQQVTTLQNEILIAQAGQAPAAPAAQQDVFSKAGLEGEEMPNVDQIREQQNQHTAQVLTALQFQNFTATNPDFFEIVGTVGAAGRLDCAEPLKELMKENPSLRGLDIAISANPAYAPVAYKLAKQHKELKDLRAKNAAGAEHQKQVDIANKTAPLSGAAASGGGAQPVQSDIANASDEEFEKIQDQVRGGAFG